MPSAISFYIPALNGGGAQKVVVNLANAMVDLTDRPVHIVLARAEGEFMQEVRPEVQIVDLAKGRASRSIFALAGYLKRERPAVLCSSLNYANVCASVAWHLAGRPCRLVLREDNVVREPSGSLVRRLQTHATQGLMQVLYGRANTVVAISEAVSQTLQDRGICRAEQTQVIGNPIAIGTRAWDPAGPKQVSQRWSTNYAVAVGRLAEQKGFDGLIRAFARVSIENLDLVILGEGPLRTNLEALARELGVGNRIHFPGFVTSPETVVVDARLFVLSSRWEGFGNVLVEALAVGIPIVSTDCPGAPRAILLDGALGHLVPPEDPESLAAAITKALHSPRGTPEARRQRANDFAAPVIARHYLEEAFGLQVFPQPHETPQKT
ncbi:MAG: glycosyltransferase [Gammaproteobacteria bacterium]|nr:glycosyltransferase [Gammaproteobacteria bacterium]